MKRLELTQHTVRCPLDDCTASLTVRTDPDGAPSGRHRDVTACSLLPAPPLVPPARRGYFWDIPAPISYRRDLDSMPCPPPQAACSKRCLAVLNAAECGTGEPLVCTSGVNDAIELARRTQTPAIMRLLWLHSA